MIIVSDTSPLCNLALVDCLWILQPIYQTVIIPQIVANELRQARSPKIQTILTLEWIEIRTLTGIVLAETLERDRIFHPLAAINALTRCALQSLDLEHLRRSKCWQKRLYDSPQASSAGALADTLLRRCGD